MSDLVEITFASEAKAEQVRQKLLTMQTEHLIELGDVVITIKDSTGNINLNRTVSPAPEGKAAGTFWGALIDDQWIRKTASALQPGTVALFLLLRKITTDEVLERLRGEGGTVMKTSLDHTKEAALQAALAGIKPTLPASFPR